MKNGNERRKKERQKKKAKKEQSSSEDEAQSNDDRPDTVAAVVSEDDVDLGRANRSTSTSTNKKGGGKSSHRKQSSSSSVVRTSTIKVDLFDAGKAAYPTEDAKKYGDIKDETIKKKCKRVYKLLNFDPWNEASRYDDDDMCDYILENPEPCDVKFEFEGFSGCIYPLSMCFALKASRDTIETVYDAYQPAIKETDFWVGTPYHYAGAYKAPPETVQFLIQKDPQGIEAVNYCGRTALHMGALFKAPRRSMELLCNKYPTAARIKDKEGYTPLHLACENGAEAGVVKLLVAAFPDAVYASSQYEMTPIHFASTQNADVDVIRAILGARDASICKLTDMLGHTPLHMALMGLAPYDVIELLVASCPETVWTKTSKGELPLEIAQRKRAPGEVLQMLEKVMERLLVENDD